MNDNESERELVLRYLEGKVTAVERQQAVELLRANRDAREFLREVAEQSVMVADLERTAQARQKDLVPHPARIASNHRIPSPVRFRAWQWGLAAAASIAVLAATIQLFAAGKTWIGKISWVSGSGQVFGSSGKLENALPVGMRLGPGDTIETRSCDAQVAMELRDKSGISIIGRSALRILDDKSDAMRFELVSGQLWVAPAARPASQPLFIQTPTLGIEAGNAQFYLQTTATETTVRVNRGLAQVRQNLDGSVVDVPAGHQVTASFSRPQSLAVLPRPTPGNSWACDLGSIPDVVFGRWLPANETGKARLGTIPLLWPLPDQKSVMLYVAGLSVLCNSERPILLEAGSMLVVRGRTARAQTARFGFMTQKSQGVFAGKFEMDVQPEAFGPPGETWEVKLPLSEFRPLQPELSTSPGGLELTDIYALTIQRDAGLEIDHLELLPGDEAVR
jgi:ferric-dicitrate binding protein FerR (iron transport regulator)